MKNCPKCNLNKELSEFAKDPSTKDGFSVYCRQCRKIINHNAYLKYKQARSEKSRADYLSKKELYKAKQKARYVKKRNLMQQKQKEYYLKNKESIKAKTREYQALNPHIQSKSHKKWAKNNKHKVLAKLARRRAAMISRIPPWLSDDKLNEIKQIYKDCPKGYHVDHIVPLQGKEVSGLHVPWNLQYLPAEENLKKSNKLLNFKD